MKNLAWQTFLGGIFFLALCNIVSAVPAPPFPIVIENQDGSTLWARMFGDEYLSWTEDLDGWAVAFDESTGFWNYARLGDDGRLHPTQFRHGTVDPKTLGLQRHLMPSKQVRQQIRRMRDRLMQDVSKSPSRVSGTLCNLVILVKFANQNYQFQSSEFDPVFNGSSGSFKAFYSEVSYGLVNFTSTIVGWITLPQNDRYYAYNSDVYGHPEQMIKDATDILDNQGFDFTQFDCNNDGKIDAVDIIHSGPGYETTNNSNYIHSHYASLTWTGDTFYKDGVLFDAYHTEPEIRADGVHITQIGVIVHETGHFLGLPDLYDYGYDSGGIGLWGLMASGPWAGPDMDGTVPSHFSIWSKYKLGWVEPQRIQANTNGITLHPVERNSEGVLINTQMPYNQYFLLEDRQKLDSDSYLPGEGLLIFHIDDNQSNNDDQNHYWVDLEQADGLRELNTSAYEYGDSSDPWPYGSKDAFTPTSNPNSKPYGSNSSVISVLNIQRSGDNVTFDVSIDGSAGSYLNLSPASLSFSGTVGGQAPSSKSVNVSHQGSSSLSWSATSQNGWIHVSPSSGTTPTTTNISVNPSGLNAGTHTGSVRFTSPSAQNSPQILSVSFILNNQPPVISLSSTSMDFSAVEGSKQILSQSLVVSNAGGGTLNWITSSDSQWLRVSPSSGTAPSQVDILVDPSSLSSGHYSGSIHFTSSQNTEGWLDVNLLIEQPAHLAVAPVSLTFSAQIGADSPSSKSLSITNTNGGQMSWSVVCSSSWLSCSPDSGLSPGYVSVNVNTAGLPAGQYSSSIQVDSQSADNSPILIPVNMTILAANTPPTKPVPISPSQGADIYDTNPELTVQNSTDQDGDTITYEFEVYPVGTDTVLFSADNVPEGISFTTLKMTKSLAVDSAYQWRARCRDSNGASSEWSDKILFTIHSEDGSSGGCGCSSSSRPASSAFLWLLAVIGLASRRRD